MKLSAAGQLEWSKTLGDDANEWGNAIVQTRDDGFAVAGATASYGNSDKEDLLLTKFDADGNIVWAKIAGDPNRVEECRSLLETSEGGVIAVGKTNAFGMNTMNLFLARFNEVGKTPCSIDITDSLTLLDVTPTVTDITDQMEVTEADLSVIDITDDLTVITVTPTVARYTITR